MKVLFICSLGMSSSITVNAMKDEAEKQGIDIEVNSVGSTQAIDELAKGYDVAMVAPQIRHRFKELEQAASAANVPIELIEPMAYSPIGSKKLLKQVLDLYEKNK
ncbi:PTS sugar transporter subunit IIB [Anaerococcus sp. Marseille-P3915]|uniref:PTS sugar transporter subunit IIB n=1 Tax=Anaerococcus sp. Marseille-P3915 TaxID=2057799 RepID=UPI000D0B1125|nr:PTS sugar transporter subunit IIB [Anaerococcus sp. Marseille-P3915]